MVSRTRDLSMTGFKADYNAMKGGPFRPVRSGLPAMGSGFDWHFRSEFEYFRMMEMARDVMRNDIVVGQAVRRLTDNVLQGGFPVDPQTGDKDIDSLLLESWQGWGSDKFLCHYNQKLNWSKIEELAFQSMISDGDFFALPTDGGSLDLLEAHRCRTPGVGNRSATKKNVVLGVLQDDQGTPQEFWFSKQDIGFNQVSTVGQMAFRSVLDAHGQPNVLHLIDHKRVTQTRGVTAFVPMFDLIGMNNDRQFAEMIKANIQSCYIWARELQQWSDESSVGTAGEVEIRESAQSRRLLQHIYPGMEVALKRGEKLVTASPQVGTSDFINHTHLILQFMSVNLDLPVAVMLLDASLTNFSGWRGAIEQARISWRRWQQWLIESLHMPTYRWKVRQWLAERSDRGTKLRAAVRAGTDVFKHVWHPAGWTYIEPLKDVQSDYLEWSTGLNSRRRVLGRKQLDITAVDFEHAMDTYRFFSLCRGLTVKLNTEQPTLPPVDWQLFLYGAPKGLTLAMQADGKEQPAAPPNKQGAANAG